MGRSSARLKEIAKALNISTGTVSRALSGRGEIATSTREQVREYAARLNYTTPRGRAKRDSAFRRISVSVGNRCVSADGTLDPSFVGFHYVVALERAASAAQLGVLVGFMDAEADISERLPLFQSDETQGVILVYPYPETFVRSLSRRLPVVSIEHTYPSVATDTIGPAHATDAMAAVQYLYELGHRRIAYVGDEDARGHRLTTGLRHCGYLSGLIRCGLPYQPNDVINVLPPYVKKPDLAAWVKVRRKDGVTAVITAIDRHGYLLWEQLPEHGIRVPEDMSIVGIGGIHRSAGKPQLTTWRCDYDTIAKIAIEALKARHEGRRSIDLYQEISSVFVKGSSSGPPNEIA